LEIVAPINDFLDEYFGSRKNAIIGLRASSIPASPNDHIFLPVVQWQEGVETEATAIFHVEEAKICNVLIHYGDGTTFQPDGNRWRNRRVKWTVRNFERLKALFVALMPAVGKQRWQDDGLETRLFNSVDAESDEYCALPLLSEFRSLVSDANFVVRNLLLERILRSALEISSLGALIFLVLYL